jgi:hypothetical protein
VPSTRTKEGLLFKSYPGGGKELIGSPKGASCRREYGLRLMQIAGQHACAYCGADFTSAYEVWLTMALDHVVPTRTGEDAGISEKWLHDYMNLVLACGACNSFKNRDLLPAGTSVATLDEFLDLRDRVFVERKAQIMQAREEERRFHETRPWQQRNASGKTSASV